MQKDNIEETSVEAQESKYFQWIKGDDMGRVVTIKDIDDQWINFNEGGRLAKDLRNEFIKSLEEDIAKEFVKTETPKFTPTPPNIPQNITEDVNISKNEISPIRVLFDKQKNYNKVKLVLDFPVNIPNKGIYELMSTSFDTDEVNQELHDFISDQLSKDGITDCLFDSIKSLIESKYKAE